MTARFEPKQLYKNRAEAYRLFIQPQELPVGQTKFYNDAERLGMIRTDKSLELATLLAYVKDELKIDPATGQSLVRKDNSAEQAELELRKLRAETERKERENDDAARELDKKWLHRDVAEESLAALIGALQDALDHQVYIGTPGLIQMAAGDSSRVEEVTAGVKDLMSNAFTEVLTEGKIEGVFQAEENESDEE